MSGKDLIDLGTVLIVIGAVLLITIPLLIHFIIKKNNTY